MSCIGRNIERIQALRGNQVLVFASSQLDIDLLPALYDMLSGLEQGKALDVVFQSRGGVVNAARRIALLLREFSDRVCFLVPHYCESAGTVAALSADEIVAGPLAIFSPVDPQLSAASGGGGPMSMSAQDLRLFAAMAVEWFGLEQEEARSRSLSILCENVFPGTLTSFYRSTLEVQDICEALLSLHMGEDRQAQRRHITEKLLFDFHSHTYALTRDDLLALGLPVTIDRQLEPLMWSISSELRKVIGPASRDASRSDWLDACLATAHGACVRRRSEDFPGTWQDLELN